MLRSTPPESDETDHHSCQYRTSHQATRRSGRTQPDHDVFEGLPVRNWRRQTTVVGAPAKVETSNNRNLPTELPMPKDSHLLCPMSRALLQAARAGRINKPPVAGAEVKEGPEEDDAGKDEAERVFSAKRWQPIPRHLEGPEPEYLAKRRKGLKGPRNDELLGLSSGAGVVKRTTVRKTDLEGNSMVEEVLVPEGQKIEGEIISEVTMTDASAPGTVLEGVGIVNAEGVVVASDAVQPTPPRRRPPPPRRKPKGFKRGRRKQVQFSEGADGTAGVVANQHRDAAQDRPDGEALEHAPEDRDQGQNGEDVEMGDESNPQYGEDEEDEGDEGEEGEEGDDEDREDGELPPSRGATESTSPMKRPLPDLPRSAVQPSSAPSHDAAPQSDTAVSSIEKPVEVPAETGLAAPVKAIESGTTQSAEPVPEVTRAAMPLDERPEAIGAALDQNPEESQREASEPKLKATQISDIKSPSPPPIDQQAPRVPTEATGLNSGQEPAAPDKATGPPDQPLQQAEEVTEEPTKQESTLPVDKEVDLLGSLEQHLDGQREKDKKDEPRTALADAAALDLPQEGEKIEAAKEAA